MPLPLCFINLARDQERRARLESELLRLRLDGERIEAVWWADLPATAQSALYSEKLNRQQYYKPLVNGEKGCYASHLAAWQKLLDSQAPALIVLEDDVQLDPRFLEVTQAIAALTMPWDMVKLMGREQEKVRARRPLTATTELIDYLRVPSMTAGYVISRAGAAKLLAARRPFGRPIDVDLRFWWECDLRILGVVPPVVLLDDTSLVSSIGQKPAMGVGAQWRKFRMKLQLTVLNTLHHLRKSLIA